VVSASLLGLNGCPVVKNTYIPDQRNAEYYKKRPCAQKVESAARVFAEYLLTKQQ